MQVPKKVPIPDDKPCICMNRPRVNPKHCQAQNFSPFPLLLRAVHVRRKSTAEMLQDCSFAYAEYDS